MPWRAGQAETVRATRGRGGLGRVLPAHEEGDDPDMRAPRGSGGEREGGGAGRAAGLGREGGAGPAGKEKEKIEEGKRVGLLG